MEAHKFMMDRLESIIDYHGKELAILKNRVMEVEKISGGSADTSPLKADIDVLKNEVTTLRSTNFSTFFDGLENPPLKVDEVVIPREELIVEVSGDGSEENQQVSTLDTNDVT